jgi:PST family polysaccharide transporter
MGLGLTFFILLMLFAKPIASSILGDLQGGNTIEGVSFVIRIISTTLLIVPLLSVTKGYLQGHKIMAPSSISNILEQVVRVSIIVGGSFIALKVFNSSLEEAVGIAVFGATIGALVAFLYLFYKIQKNKDKLNKDEPMTRSEVQITTKDIIKKIIFYALPFVVIDLAQSAFYMVDTFTVVNTMVKLGFGNIAETTIGTITTWASKLNMIVISISTGIIISLIPNIASSYVKKDMTDVSKKINQALQILLFAILPMTIGLHFLATPTWVLFYSYDIVSISIFKIFIFQALSFSIYMLLIDIFQTMNDTKIALGTLFGSFFGKLLLNIPMMHLCKLIGIDVYYGPSMTTLLVHMVAIIFLFYKLKTKYKINYQEMRYNALKTILCVLIMVIVLKILNIFLTIDAPTRIEAFIKVGIYSFVGALVYITVAYSSRLIHHIFGENIVKMVISKIPFVKKKIKLD